MKFNLLKKLELTGKHLLQAVIRFFLRQAHNPTKLKTEFDTILVLRLDERIGNGLLLLPLLDAIRRSRPGAHLHLLIHFPVARLIREFAPGLVDQFWDYNQKELLYKPHRFLIWLFQLRQHRFDLIISSHNPDNFSFSQALLGRWCSPGLLVGFDWKDSADFYDMAIHSDCEKHYSESQLDLWRHFEPGAKGELNLLNVDQASSRKLHVSLNLPWPPPPIFWLGATGDKQLPVELIEVVDNLLKESSGSHPLLALGVADRNLLQILSPSIKKRVLIWDRPLNDTARLFAGCPYFISADTGPMHLAVALGLPTLTIFYNSRPRQYGYNDGERHFSIEYKPTEKDITPIASAIKILAGAKLKKTEYEHS